LATVPIGIVGFRQLASGASPPQGPPTRSVDAASDSWARLLSLSTDLGPARVISIEVLVTLASAQRPVVLEDWARNHRLAVTWSTGERFAVVSGSSASVGSAFGAPVDSYRSRSGEAFYSAIRQPGVPAPLRPGVTGIGSINNYGRLQTQLITHDFVPNGGLTPQGLLEAYQATPLSDTMQGTGETVVFLEGSPVEQSDLNAFTQKFSLPQISLQIVGGNASGGPSESDEADMDIETVHEIAPQARLVYYNVNSAPGTTNNSDLGAALALSIAAITHQFSGAIISASLGLCERQQNSADIQAISTAAAAEEATGGTVFASSGDTGGADCGNFGTDSLSSAEGVEIPAAAPNVTGVGGTSLSVTTDGGYVGETTWSLPMMSQGSGGGVSTIAARPSWQTGPGVGGPGIPDMREVPDVAADADPTTGTAYITDGQLQSGGGTSLATPIWAGFTVLIDQFLRSSGQSPIGFANPVFYRLAANTQLSPPPFHDVTVGGNVFYAAGQGYDPVTGLGSPDVAALAQYILNLDKGGSG
jgi:kumamolisin